ncbi:MAG: aldo/keto reductase [Nitrospinae bacterium]|nr:aldo/keto reductase [Nitrospinota bacterium]
MVHAGKARSAGVSNFNRRQIDQAIAACPVSLATNQVEFHPFFQQPLLLEHCRSKGIMLTAYCPLAKGQIWEDARSTRVTCAHLAERVYPYVLGWVNDVYSSRSPFSTIRARRCGDRQDRT